MRRAGKWALYLLLAALLCASLAACHGSRGPGAFVVPEQFDESREYTITFWAKNDTNKAQTAIYEKAIAEFTALYPNIHVVLRLYTDYSRIYNDVITNIATNTTPNVCVTYPDHIATYLTGNNVVAPLDDLFASPLYGLGGEALRYDAPSVGEILPKYLEECVIGGTHYAIPFMRSTEACYINKTFVEALGYELPDTLTWEFVWEVAEAAAAKDEDGVYALNGQKVMIPFLYKSTDNMMIQMLRQLGAGYATAEGDILLLNDTTAGILKQIAALTGAGAFSTFKISSYPANFLNAGQCVFAIDSTAGATWMGTDAPLSDISEEKLVPFEIAVQPVPQYDTENMRMISQGPSVCVFNKSDPQEVLASWLFAQYLLTNDVQIAYAETEGYVPVTRKAQEAPEYMDYLSRGGEDNTTHYSVKIEATKLLIAHVNDTFVTPVYNGSASLRDAAGHLIESVTKSVRRKQEVNDEYIEALYADVTKLYRLNQGGDTGETTGMGKAALGTMPIASKALLAALAAAWTAIGLYAIHQARARKRSAK